MTKHNLMFIENGYAHLIVIDRETGDRSEEIITTCLGRDRYVRIDDGRNYPQLCVGGSRQGRTLIYQNDETLARNCNARLYKTRKGFERAKTTHPESIF